MFTAACLDLPFPSNDLLWHDPDKQLVKHPFTRRGKFSIYPPRIQRERLQRNSAMIEANYGGMSSEFFLMIFLSLEGFPNRKSGKVANREATRENKSCRKKYLALVTSRKKSDGKSGKREGPRFQPKERRKKCALKVSPLITPHRTIPLFSHDKRVFSEAMSQNALVVLTLRISDIWWNHLGTH